ncbi:hypothetical protein CCACVL1_17153 [Corchorus capsularis]|uniref:Mediator of RNA polymerase II transcription subunit 29 n=1 Tax=Corchorus capsularis TaxID=210143 RepID=A0A1R3HTN8_COCAP|nr:hypothetical protein CCACVL1_17153 [Corchorus capsularis]
MDNVVDCLSNAYQDFFTAATNVAEAKASSNGDRSGATDAALENFKKKWDAFKLACDQANEFVDTLKQSITANTSYPVNEDMIDIFDHAVHVDEDHEEN